MRPAIIPLTLAVANIKKFVIIAGITTYKKHKIKLHVVGGSRLGSNKLSI